MWVLWCSVLQVKMLEKLVQAVTAVEHRKAAYGRGKAEGQPETGIDDVAQVRDTMIGPCISSLSVCTSWDHIGPRCWVLFSLATWCILYRPGVQPNFSGLQFLSTLQVMRTGPRMAPTVRGRGGGYSSDNSAQMLSVLTPEARTLVLTAMPASQRWTIMEAMKDEERAEIVIAIGLDLRKDAAAALEPKTWERTIDIVKNSGNLASRCDVGSLMGELLSCLLHHECTGVALRCCCFRSSM